MGLVLSILSSVLSSCCTLFSSKDGSNRLEEQTHQSSSYEDPLVAQTHQSSSSYEDPLKAQAHQSSSSSSTSTATPNRWSYDVFLSFRGADTRTKFTDHLYTALTQASVNTFRDDDKLKRGKDIGSSLLEAIEESRISIPVFSKNYASSKWCLKEIASMVECMDRKGQTILPIFLDIDPYDVGHQTGSFAEAFRKHGELFEEKTVERWRQALKKEGKLSGWNLEDVANGHEATLISLVLNTVLMELNNTDIDVAKHPVGTDSRAEEMMRLLPIESNDVLFIGIWGLGGIGKTTIAKAVHNKISRQFESVCFLADIREATLREGLVTLQKQLLRDILNERNESINAVDKGKMVLKARLCSKKVLLVLDDVDDNKQLEALAGEPDWFHPGSLIIITTRDEQVLKGHHVSLIYKPEELDFDQSLQLFSKHAFCRVQPPKNYSELSKVAVRIAGGLPLALEVFGSFLSGKKPIEWESALDLWKRIPYTKVQERLKLSYNGLEYNERNVFLDIACFFIGMNKEIAINIWESCGFHSVIGIKVLVQKSLVKIDDSNKLRMHDQIRDMGRDIVNQEYYDKPWMRSRLWMHKEALDVLKKKKGTENIKGLHVDFRQEDSESILRIESFASMSNLRLLRVNYAHLEGEFEHLPKALRWLSWKGCPLEYIPISHLEELVVLDLSGSSITQIRSDFHQNKLLLKNLKVLDISGSDSLTRTSDLSELPCLERLILRYCVNLVEVDVSIGFLQGLVFLDLGSCEKLMELPSSICRLKSLKILVLSGCSELYKLPEHLGAMKSLTELFVDHTAINQLPDSIGVLKNLTWLSLEGCRSMSEIPDSIWIIESLIELNLAETELKEIPDFCRLRNKIEMLNIKGCKLFSRLPDSIGNLRNLKVLYVDRTIIAELPDSVGSLEKLEELTANGCKKLRKLPDSMAKMRSLKYFDIHESGIVKLPEDFGMLSSLKKLKMDGCQRFIGSVPVSFSGLCSLEELSASYCNLSEDGIPCDFGRLTSLRTLELKGNGFYSLPTSICSLSQLQTLSLTECKKLHSLPKLPSSLTTLEARHCSSLERLPDLLNLKRLNELNLQDCEKLEEILGLEGLETLEELYLRCTSIERLPDLSNLKKLTILDLTDCRKLAMIQLNEKWKTLKELYMGGCSSSLANCLRKSLVLGVLESSSLRLLTFPGSDIPDWFTPLKLSHDGDDVIRLSCKVPPSRRQQLDIKITGVMMCFVFTNQGKVSGTKLGVDLKRNGVHVFWDDYLVNLSPPQTNQEQFYFCHFQEKEDDPRGSKFVSVLKEGDKISFRIKLPVKKGGIHAV